MKKDSILLSALAIVLCGIIFYQQYEIHSLKGKTLNTQDQVNNYDLQRECSQDASKFFQDSVDPKAASSYYLNNYSSTQGKCFIDIWMQIPNKNVSSGYNFTETVWDVNSAQIHAMYNADQRFIGAKALLCKVEEATCSDSDGFHALIKQEYGIDNGA